MASSNSPRVMWLLVIIVAVWATCAEAQLSASPRAVDAALRNPRFMRRQISCLLNEAPCDNIGTPLKRMMPNLIRGHCPGCSEEQYSQAMKVIHTFSNRYPQEYSRIYYTYINQG